MEFARQLNTLLRNIDQTGLSKAGPIERIKTEIEFASKFIHVGDGLFRDGEGFEIPSHQLEELVLRAAQLVENKLTQGGPVDPEAVAAEAERVMAPIGKAAKECTIHCCGHAHIDMNWLWPWQDTVSVAHDTFSTVDRLMEEFPEFHFSQSQASTYAAMEKYCPEVFEMIKRRVKEGRWEPTASMWVEGSKNLASGEILCRHLLYTRRYFKEKFGLPYESIKIDWEPDTFGHAHTVPNIIAKAGVTRYYHCRTGPNYWLAWWQGPDGSRVLLFLDKAWYNGAIVPNEMAKAFVDYVKETGVKDALWLYGVGDHGGGPTRRDLTKAMEMKSWPVFPDVKLSTTDAFFEAVEKSNPDLPVHDGELNFVFEGCYTSESNIKYANRVSENVIPEVEAISLVAGAATGFPYPTEDVNQAWQYAMFNQFHDILPGSGIPETYKYSQGLFQEIKALIGSIRTRAMRRLASAVDTSKVAVGAGEYPDGEGSAIPPQGLSGDSLGAGAGDTSIPGGVSAYVVGAVAAEPFVVFNQMGFPRSEVVQVRIWDKDVASDRVIVRDETGKTVAGQVIETGDYWGHKYATVLFPAKDVPAMGYKVYTVDQSPKPVVAEPAPLDLGYSIGGGSMAVDIRQLDTDDQALIVSPGVVLENSYVRVEIDGASGGIKHLIDKSTGYDLVPEGELMGVLEVHHEAPHAMSAWQIGQVQRVDRLVNDGFILAKDMGYDMPMWDPFHWWGSKDIVQAGPHRAAVRVARKYGSSRIVVEVGLNAGSPAVDFKIITDWRELGTHETGVPMLRMAFPTKLNDTKARYEIPFGSIERPTNGREVPALKWADLSGDRIGADGSCGITLVNDCKYGHNADGSMLRITLLRSSYDPDPVPEIGHHEIRVAVIPHDGRCVVSDASKSGAAFNLPMSVASTDIHEGALPSSKSFAEVLNPNVMLASLKKAEDSDAVVVRLYEMDGKDTEARVKLSDVVKPGASAVEVDLMEQPLADSTAKMDGDTLVVRIPAYGIVTVAVG